MTPPPTIAMCLLMSSRLPVAGSRQERFRQPATGNRQPSTNPPRERIVVVQNQRRFPVHVCATPNRRPDIAVDDVHVPFEQAAHDALLTPHLTGGQFPVIVETREL